MKMGLKEPRHDPRTLQLAHYLSHDLPPPPPYDDWRAGLPSYPMLGNDSVSDCVFVAFAQAARAWLKNTTGKVWNPADSDVIACYSACTGYNPADPTTDGGTVLLDGLNWWRKNTLLGHPLGAFVRVNPKNLLEMKAGHWMAGGLILGLALPLYAQQQFQAGYEWESRLWAPQGLAEPASWGRHAVYSIAFDAEGVILPTWARLQRASWSFLLRYCFEAWALLGPDWIKQDGKAPSGFDLDQLQADLSALSS